MINNSERILTHTSTDWTAILLFVCVVSIVIAHVLNIYLMYKLKRKIEFPEEQSEKNPVSGWIEKLTDKKLKAYSPSKDPEKIMQGKDLSFFD